MLIQDKHKQTIFPRNVACQYKQLFFHIKLFSAKMINVGYTVW